MKNKKRILAAALSICMVFTSTGLTSLTVKAEEGKTIHIDFSQTDGEMVPKTGWLLIPNENIPDGRILPLNTKDVRDDIDTQNLLGNNGNGNSTGQLQDVLPNEGNRLARIKHGVERMKELGVDNYYPIMGYMPSWISSNGKPQGTPKDYALWKQWVKDIVQYMKDNDLDVTEYNVWNENWAISVDNFNKMYEQAWHAGREVMADSKMIGPSPWTDDAGSIKSLADSCEANDITLDIVSWHFGNYNNIPGFQQGLADYISQKPSIGEPKYYYEEYTNSENVGNLQVEFTTLANFDRADVDAAVRGIWTYVNGLSDQLITVQSNENPYQRRNIWWLMTTYGAMSGTRVKQSGEDLYVASYDEEKGEAKILIGGQQGDVTIHMDHFPFEGENVRVDKYKVTDIENDGLQYQGTDETVTAQDAVSTEVNFANKNEIWLLEVKKEESIPADFALMGPDDGLTAVQQPKFSWQASQGAEAYDFVISKNKDMSDPVFTKEGITDTTYTLEGTLEKGETYYWTVTAKNAFGSKEPYNGMYYTLLANDDTEIPGPFTMLQVIDEDFGTSLTPKVTWTQARNAEKYVIHISESENFEGETTIEVTDPPKYSAGQNNEYFYRNLTEDEALKPETHYYAKVEAVNGHGNRMMNGTAHEFTTTTADGKPAEFSMTMPENASTIEPRSTLRWEPSVGSFFYRLEIAEDEAFENVVLRRDTITVPAYTLEENVLEPEKTYYWRVTAVTKDGTQETECQDGIRTFTMSEKPTAPIVKTAIPATGGAVVTFEGVQEADSYLVKYGTGSETYSERVEAGEEKAYIPLPSAEETYTCTVVAVRNGVESESYNEVTACSKEKSQNDMALEKKTELEDADQLEETKITAKTGSSGSLAVNFEQPGAQAEFSMMIACDKIQLAYQAESDTVLAVYVNDQHIKNVDLYQTLKEEWGTVTIELNCAEGDKLSLRKETKGSPFVLDYMVPFQGEKYENLALEKSAVADSAGQSYTADKAVDGKLAGDMDFWIAGTAPSEEKPNWLSVDLGDMAEIHSFVIALPNISTWGARTQEFRILTSKDGENYEEAIAKTSYEFNRNTNDNKYEVTLETAVEATHVKVEVYSNSDVGKVGQIGELLVMGKWTENQGDIDISGKNLALNKAVSADGITYGQPSAIVDGNKTSFADFGSVHFPNHVIVDLGEFYALERFELYLPSQWGSRTQEIEFLSSADGKEYTSLVEKASYKFEQGSNHVTVTLPENSAGRFIQIIGTANDEIDEPGLQFSEFEVYGSYGQPVEEIHITQKDVELKVLTTLQMNAELVPDNATNTMIAWSSSDVTVATVDKNGLVTAVAPGEAVIQARSLSGNLKDTCKVTVVEKQPVVKLPYEDVAEEDWYYDAVHYNYLAKTMTGLNEKEFGPGKALVRADFAVILHRMEGTPEVEYKPVFPDVEDGIWYTDAVLWANSTGIVKGYQDTGLFGPADCISREQMVSMLYRYAEYKGYDVSSKADLAKFEDAENVSEFAEEAMQWAVAAGIISGKGDGTILDTQGSANRAECAAIIMRFMEAYE